tara:strand:+ start:503 stop:1546 length:1044 start_codon:yes stop_codon:yes gene_type:complete
MAYTTIDDPSAHFQIALYTGDGNSTQAITNDGNSDLQPDWIWTKQRSHAVGHNLTDSSRGASKSLFSESTAVEDTGGNISSFNSDGFTTTDANRTNQSGRTFVAWQWKANGGTTSSNTDGDITSTVQANTTAGFSIVTYTGNGTDGASVGHGLSGAYDVIIVKNRGQTDYWTVDRDASSGTSNALLLHDPSQESGHGTIHFRGSNGVFSSHSNGDLGMGNGNGETYVAYVFKQIKGYSRFGSYTGNGSSDGTFIFTGFSPAWVLTKSSTHSEAWMLSDNKRPGYNSTNQIIEPNDSAAEGASTTIDHLSNGFKFRHENCNVNGQTYFYMAFAHNPFTSSKGVPTTAR